MIRFFKDFYAQSRAFRLFVTSLLLLGGALVIAGAGLYQFFMVFQADLIAGNELPKERGAVFSGALARIASTTIPEYVRGAVALQEVMAAAADENGYPRMGSLTPELMTRVEAAVTSISRLPVSDLLLFAHKSSVQSMFDESMSRQVNYGAYRQRARFLASLTMSIPGPAGNLDPILLTAAAVRSQVLTTQAWPMLIGKMIDLAVGQITDRALEKRLRSGDLSSSQACALLEIMKEFDPLRVSYEDSMRAELVYAERAYFRLAWKAPLGNWILEKVFGDPIAQYRQILPDLLAGRNIEMDWQTHILLKIMIPNVKKAEFKDREIRTKHAIFMQELARVAGPANNFPDAWGKPLQEVSGGASGLSSSAIPVWYSLGPDGIDQQGKGDDILFLP